VRRERLPRVDRQHAAAARLQALQVRLGWPAALQQDSRLQVRAEIVASALGRFPRRIHDLPVQKDSRIRIVLIHITAAASRFIDKIGHHAMVFCVKARPWKESQGSFARLHLAGLNIQWKIRWGPQPG